MSDNEVEKNRYTIVANNKVNFLLENPYRIKTFPLDEKEKEINEAKRFTEGEFE